MSVFDASRRHDPPEAAHAGRVPRCVLTLNGGSSSLKFAVFAADGPPMRVRSGGVERIGRAGSRMVLRDSTGSRIEETLVEAPNQAAAARLVLDRLGRDPGLDAISAVGHRVVHGGDHFFEPALITAEMIDGLRRIAPLDPEHLPGEITLIESFEGAIPGVPQIACFDTAFHRTMPPVARIVAIPRRYWELGIRRYGFHGISYAYLMEELARIAPEESRGRVILAHLGSGASLAAVHDGRCIDTTMGFTPASGLVMGTRCGDTDPGLAVFLAHAAGMTAGRFQRMANEESGLLGVSETSADLRDLLDRQSLDARAAEAVELFCYRATSAIGALTAALGGLDTLVFAAGIGENSHEVRRRICDGLGFLGISLDEARNAIHAPIISVEGGATRVRVIPTDEETMIARETVRLAVASF